MTDLAATLEALEHWLGRSVGNTLAAALAVAEPAGGSPVWTEFLTAYGVAALGPEERARFVAVTGVRFGAPVGELQDVLDTIAGQGRTALDRIDYPDDNALARRWDRLACRLNDLRAEIVGFYRNQVMPKRSMFGDALAAARARAGDQGAAPAGERQAFILRCDRCGGPRLDAGHFDCLYCGARLGAGGP